MPQLSFDGFIERAEPSAPRERAESWYTGRVLSHSSIQTYKTCPQKWKFRYIDKVPEKPRSFFSFGKSVHAGLEFLFSKAAALPSLEELLAEYKNGWLRDGYETPAQEKWFYQEGERILRGFHAKHRADAPSVVHVEYKFTIDIDGVPVTGFIDRVDATKAGGLGIVDYKTGKAFDKARVRTDPQLTLYQIACQELLGKPVETVTLYHLNSLTPLTVPAHSKEAESAVRTTVVEVAKGISENRFDAKPDDYACQYCDYAQICPAVAKKKLTAAPGVPDAIATAVDRFARLDAKIQELSLERTQLAKTLLDHMARTGVSELEGQRHGVNRRVDEAGRADLSPKVLETKPDA